MQWICGWGFAVMDRSNANLCGNIPGTPEFLRNLRQETEQVGAILIFDEVNISRCGQTTFSTIFVAIVCGRCIEVTTKIWSKIAGSIIGRLCLLRARALKVKLYIRALP